MKKHTEIYKYEWKISKTTSMEDFTNCPEYIHSFRILDGRDSLHVIAIVSDNEKFNTIKRETLESYVHIVQDCIENDEKIPEWLARHPMKNTLAYEQPGCAILCQFYEPLVHALAHRAHQTLDRFWSINDLLQIAYLSIIKLSRYGYYCTKGLIEKTFFNELFVSLRKLPTHHVVISIEEPTNDSDGDDAVTRLIDTIADPVDEYQKLLDDAEVIAMRDIVISLIGQRKYDQYLREYRTNTVSGSTAAAINKLKRRFRDEQL